MKKIFKGCLALISVFVLFFILFIVFGIVETTTVGNKNELNISFFLSFLISLLVFIILIYKINKKKSDKKLDKLADVFLDKQGNEVYQFQINDLDEEFLKKFKETQDLEVNIYYKDNHPTVDLMFENKKIGFIYKNKFNKTLKYLNNERYIIDSKITLDKLNEKEILAFSLLIIDRTK